MKFKSVTRALSALVLGLALGVGGFAAAIPRASADTVEVSAETTAASTSATPIPAVAAPVEASVTPEVTPTSTASARVTPEMKVTAAIPTTAAPATTAVPTYVTVAWVMPSWINATTPSWPQTYALSVKTNTASLGALDSDLKCGVPYQVDVYFDNDVTASLIAGKHLDGPGVPPEALIPGGWGAAYKVVMTKCPPVENKVCTTIAAGPVSTNLNDLWSNVDTRSAGHVEYVANGLHVWTDDATSNAKVSEGIAVNFPLKNTGALSLAWTGSTPPPGINLFVNFGADGNGTLVYESVYGQDLWLTNGSSAAVKAKAPVNGGGNGSQWHGTITQWLSVYPDAQVVGVAYSLGSGVKGDGVISSITAGCTKYTFDYKQSPKPDDKVWTGEWTNGEWGCGDTSVEQTLEVVTTSYVLKGREWVLDTEHAVTTYEHRTVALTEDQVLLFQNTDPKGQCFVEPKTKDALIETTTAAWDCNATTAVTSTVTTTYAFAFDPKTGTYGDPVATVTTVPGTRNLTAAEFVACPVTVPTLAKTGADATPWGLVGGAAALVSGLVLLVSRKRK